MKKVTVLLCAIFLVFGYLRIASASAVWLTGVSQASGWSDVEQAPYGLLCWAASSSNMLAHAGWTGGPPLTNASQIFNDFSSSWTNEIGNPYYGINWWFTGVNGIAGSSGWSQMTKPGGNFYSQALFTAANGYAENLAGLTGVLGYIKDDVAQNRVFSLLLGTKAFGGIHWLTGWGYETDASGNIDGVWVTDSDDNKKQIKYEALTLSDGIYYMNDYFNGLFVIAIDSLGINNGNKPVPEPVTLILLGFGLMGLAGVRRKFRN